MPKSTRLKTRLRVMLTMVQEAVVSRNCCFLFIIFREIRRICVSDQTQRGHGGDWTRIKLGCLQGYLEAYATALKNFGFQRIYIDAFSGTGEPYKIGSFVDDAQPTALIIDESQVEFFDGSVR